MAGVLGQALLVPTTLLTLALHALLPATTFGMTASKVAISSSSSSSSSSTTTTSQTNGLLLHAISSPWVTLKPYDDGDTSWTLPTKAACAFYCRYHYQDCQAFYYEEATGFCVPGTLVSKKEGKFFGNRGAKSLIYHVNHFCDESKFLYVAILDNAHRCLFVDFDMVLGYDQARAECGKRQTHFLLLKTQQDIDAYLTLDTYLWFWVGLDNRLDGTLFAWSDDNQTLTDAQKAAVFPPHQPDNLHGAGNGCVYYNPEWGKLDDTDCAEAKNVICVTSACDWGDHSKTKCSAGV